MLAVYLYICASFVIFGFHHIEAAQRFRKVDVKYAFLDAVLWPVLVPLVLIGMAVLTLCKR